MPAVTMLRTRDTEDRRRCPTRAGDVVVWAVDSRRRPDESTEAKADQLAGQHRASRLAHKAPGSAAGLLPTRGGAARSGLRLPRFARPRPAPAGIATVVGSANAALLLHSGHAGASRSRGRGPARHRLLLERRRARHRARGVVPDRRRRFPQLPQGTLRAGPHPARRQFRDHRRDSRGRGPACGGPGGHREVLGGGRRRGH